MSETPKLDSPTPDPVGPRSSGPAVNAARATVVGAISSVAGMMAIVAGGLVILGWALDIAVLKSVSPGWVAMKPNTAVAFILLGLALLLGCRQSAAGMQPRAVLSRLASMLAGLIGLLSLAEYTFDWNPGFDQWLFPEPQGAVGTSHPGRMAPDTAICFALLAVGLESSHRVRRPGSSSSAPLLVGALVVMIGLIETFSYFAPVLRTYGWGGLTMMALPTAILVTALGAAVVSGAGPRLPVASTGSAQPFARSADATSLKYILIFAGLAAGIVAAGTLYYRSLDRQFRADAELQLDAVARLKVGELTQYRKERLGDGSALQSNPAFVRLVRHFLAAPADGETPQQLLAWLSLYRMHYDYDRVRLLDTQGVTRLSDPSGLGAVSSSIAQGAADVLQSGQVRLQDFYRNDTDRRIYLAVLVPLFDETDGRRPLGVVVLRIDPERYLYPFIRRWPVPSATAETLLVRREGEEAVYLNELRFLKDTALMRRVPLADTHIPAVRAALGEEGIVEGRDYRGVPVLAALQGIPGSPWSLVARRDVAEVFAPLRAQLWQIVVFVGVLLFAAAAGVSSVERQQSFHFYRSQAASAKAIQQLNLTLEQRVADRTAELAAANKELEAFSYSVSHDLRAPLRSIDGFSRIVLEDYAPKLDADGRDSLNRIRAAAQRMGQLIDDMLSLSRVTRAELRRERVDFSALVREVADGLRRQEPARVVELTVADGLTGFADPRLLRIVLENLLGNAWKFTGRCAAPRVEVGIAVMGEHSNSPAPTAPPIYFIRDNGAGFDEAYAGKLFGVFQRLHTAEQFAGTGIGLATVQRIIQRHGGRVWAEGKVGEGATFYFTLKETTGLETEELRAATEIPSAR